MDAFLLHQFQCKKAKRQAATRNAKLPLDSAVASAQTSFPSLNPQASKPTYLATAWVGDKRPRHYPPEEYCIKPRVLSNSRAVRTCHGSGKLSCLSRFVLHTFASLSHLSHLKVFGTFLLYSIRTSDLHSRPDQPCRWPPSSLQSPIRPSSQTNTMRSSWASRQSWILNRTSALFT